MVRASYSSIGREDMEVEGRMDESGMEGVVGMEGEAPAHTLEYPSRIGSLLSMALI